MRIRKRQRFFRRSTLPLALSVLLGSSADPIASETAVATTIQVQNCADSGPGSLRQILTSASTLSGSIVDMTGLTCSTISLDNGGIILTQNDLTIVGPGREALTIKPGMSTGTGLLLHFGTGALTISGLTMKDGERFTASDGHARGGCLYSHGNVAITDVAFDGCRAYGVGSGAQIAGGCVHADGNITVQSSSLEACTANAGVYDVGFGGGLSSFRGNITVSKSTIHHCRAYYGGGAISTGGRVSLDHSLISVNSARRQGAGIFANMGLDCAYSSIVGNGTPRYGGAVISNAPISIESCLIANNSAADGGGLEVGHRYGGTLSIVNSTISGNQGAKFGIAIDSQAPTFIANSTIVDNATNAAGLTAIYLFSGANLTMQNAIIAKNGSGENAQDISGMPGATITGSNNIVMKSSFALPPDTILSDPFVGPLRDNGGPTLTHALLSGSPAVNAGNSSTPRTFDQRGSPHRRVLGARQDIGAFESDPDQVFADRFE